MNSQHQHITLRSTESSVTIARHGMASLHDARGITLRVASGCAWITQDGSIADVCVQAGESFTITRDGATLLTACRPASSTVIAIEGCRMPAPSIGERVRHWAQRMVAPSTRPALAWR